MTPHLMEATDTVYSSLPIDGVNGGISYFDIIFEVVESTKVIISGSLHADNDPNAYAEAVSSLTREGVPWRRDGPGLLYVERVSQDSRMFYFEAVLSPGLYSLHADANADSGGVASYSVEATLSSVVVTPEPGTGLLVGVGLVLMGSRRRVVGY